MSETFNRLHTQRPINEVVAVRDGLVINSVQLVTDRVGAYDTTILVNDFPESTPDVSSVPAETSDGAQIISMENYRAARSAGALVLPAEGELAPGETLLTAPDPQGLGYLAYAAADLADQAAEAGPTDVLPLDPNTLKDRVDYEPAA